MAVTYGATNPSYTYYLRGGTNGYYDINQNYAFDQASASATAYFVCGWWRPTTLTSTRRYWRQNRNLAFISTTTTQIDFQIARGTTDATYRTSNAAMVTNTWAFLAFYAQDTTSGGIDVRIWKGTETSLPTALTLTTVTAGSGTMNLGTGVQVCSILNDTDSLSFQGQVSRFFMMTHQGTAAAVDATFALERLVMPMYRATADFSRLAMGFAPRGMDTLARMTASYIPCYPAPIDLIQMTQGANQVGADPVILSTYQPDNVSATRPSPDDTLEPVAPRLPQDWLRRRPLSPTLRR